MLLLFKKKLGLCFTSTNLSVPGSKSPVQHSSGSNAAPNYPHQMAASEYSAPVQYSTSRLMSQPMQFVMGPSLSQGVVQATPGFSGLSSTAPQDLSSSGSVYYSVPVENAGGSPQAGSPQGGLPGIKKQRIVLTC